MFFFLHFSDIQTLMSKAKYINALHPRFYLLF